MPNRNGNGPLGQGPRTGRGAGNCNDQPGDNRFRSGRRSVRRGAGRGFRNDQNYSNLRRRSWLKDQITSLQSAIQDLSERLDNSKKE
ncbi:DUF5320 domain-containing protein [Chloroflexota bacterium]